MTKTELVEHIAKETGLSKAESLRCVEAFISGVVSGLKKEKKVALTGFATFTCKKKPARDGRNPRTGETVKIPAKNAITIKAGSKLKDALN